MVFVINEREIVVEDNDNEVIKYIFILPGISKKDVTIDFYSSDEIIIKGEETPYTEAFEAKKYVPNNTKPENIKANIKHGILEVIVDMPTKTKIKID